MQLTASQTYAEARTGPSGWSPSTRRRGTAACACRGGTALSLIASPRRLTSSSGTTRPTTSPSTMHAGARLQAPRQRAVSSESLPSSRRPFWLHAELTAHGGQDLSGPVDVAGGSRADHRGVLTLRLQREVVVERRDAEDGRRRHGEGVANVVQALARRGSRRSPGPSAMPRSARRGGCRVGACASRRSSNACHRSERPGPHGGRASGQPIALLGASPLAETLWSLARSYATRRRRGRANDAWPLGGYAHWPMCIAYPGRIIEITDGMAVVEFGDRRQRASLLLTPDATVGDWVVIAAGTVIEVLDPAAALEVRQMLDTLTAPAAPAAGAPERSLQA